MTPTTRHALHSIPLLALLLLGAIAPLQCCSAAPTKPNIVFIFADDWGRGDLSCHGAEH